MIRQIVPIALRKQIATKTHISRREGAHVKALKENARDALVTSLAKFALLMLCLGAFVPMIAGNLLSSSPPANPGTKVTSQSPQAKKNNISLIHEIGSVEGSKAWKLPPPRRRYLALSAIPPSLHLFAEWTLIAQTLNRTLILPSLPQFWSTDAMDSATLVAAPFLGSVPLSQWLQIHPLNAKTGVEKGNSVRSGSVVAPLSEFLDVVEFDVWQAHLDARRNSTQEDLISIAFLKNVDEGVTCSAEHDDLAWPDWLSELNHKELSPLVVDQARLASTVSDICLVSPLISDPLAEIEIVHSTASASKSDAVDSDAIDASDDDTEDDSELQTHINGGRGESGKVENKKTTRQIITSYKKSVEDVVTTLVVNADVMRADLLVARKQGHNRLFPSSMINSIMTDYMFPNEDVFFLIRTAIRSTNRPLVALRWNLNGLTQESALPCAASLLRHLKRSLKMQNWNAAFLETLNAAPPPSLQDEPRLSAHVYLSTSLFPRYDAADVFTKPSKATGAASMDPPPRHLLNVYWYLRKRIHGLLDVSMLFDERDVFGEGAYHALFWELVEGVIFEEADIVLFGTGECSAASAPANQLDEWVFVERVKARRKARAFALLPDVSSDEDGPDGGPRDEDGVRIVYQTMYWK